MIALSARKTCQSGRKFIYVEDPKIEDSHVEDRTHTETAVYEQHFQGVSTAKSIKTARAIVATLAGPKPKNV